MITYYLLPHLLQEMIGSAPPAGYPSRSWGVAQQQADLELLSS